MSTAPAIAMCWDGETPTAELRINGAAFTGAPADVERAFASPNKLRDRALDAEARIAAVARRIDQLAAEMGR